MQSTVRWLTKMLSLGQQHQLTPGNLFEIQILGSHTRPTKLEALREGAHQSVSPQILWHTQKFVNHWSGEHQASTSLIFKVFSWSHFSHQLSSHFSFIFRKKKKKTSRIDSYLGYAILIIIMLILLPLIINIIIIVHTYIKELVTYPEEKEWQPTPVFLSEESCGQRSLAAYCAWGHKSCTWLRDQTNQPTEAMFGTYLYLKSICGLSEFQLSLGAWKPELPNDISSPDIDLKLQKLLIFKSPLRWPTDNST